MLLLTDWTFFFGFWCCKCVTCMSSCLLDHPDLPEFGLTSPPSCLGVSVVRWATEVNLFDLNSSALLKRVSVPKFVLVKRRIMKLGKQHCIPHDNFTTDKVCNSANPTWVGFVHMYERCYLATRDVFYTSRSTEVASQNLFGCNRRNRIAQEIWSELLYFS